MNALNGLSLWVYERADKKRLVVFALLLVAVLVVMETSPIGKGALKAACGEGMLDMRFGYSGDAVHRMFTALGPSGRILYQRLLALDVIFACIFMALQSFMLSALIRRSGTGDRFRLLNLLPAARSVLDLAENALLAAMLAGYQAGMNEQGLVPFASAITSLKWIIYYAVIAALFAFGALTTVKQKEKTR